MMNRIAAICPWRWIWAPDQMMGLPILVQTWQAPSGVGDSDKIFAECEGAEKEAGG
jgi:hypothetical protein